MKATRKVMGNPAMQPKKHNHNPQVQDAMPPHGHGVKDNEVEQSCFKSFTGLGLTQASRYIFGCIPPPLKQTNKYIGTNLIFLTFYFEIIPE